MIVLLCTLVKDLDKATPCTLMSHWQHARRPIQRWSSAGNTSVEAMDTEAVLGVGADGHTVVVGGWQGVD